MAVFSRLVTGTTEVLFTEYITQMTDGAEAPPVVFI
jgi:hypothetical protein